MKLASISLLFIFPLCAPAQISKRTERDLQTHLQQHVQFLSDDKLEGRRTGTKGEALATAYISQQFKEVGLAPKGTQAYYQPFEITEGKQVNTTSHFRAGGNDLVLGTDYFPLAASPNIRVEALLSRALQEPEMPWFWNLKETLDDARNNPHFDIQVAIRQKAAEAQKRGATALLLYNSGSEEDGVRFDATDRSDLLPLPVIYITKNGVQNYFSDESATLDVDLVVDMGLKKRSSTNVIGFIDNGAPTTVVLGAHFDHLGYGEDGNSLQRDGEKRIHNGADDNASGTAALIELARLLKTSKAKKDNYLFIAFSGEEQGLYGSKYFTEHPTIELPRINYMINMDMLGRLNPSTNALTVGGFGTSPLWATAFAATGRNKLFNGPLQLRFDSSGIGPSDHTSFYQKGLPVLFYFTGLHPDYHRPTDDADKINYAGEVLIIKHIYSLVETVNKEGRKLAFAKTRDVQMGTSARFSVTLGIMPDYTFSGAGVRVDAVSDNRPAQKAGLATGDVITALGPHPVASIESYMQALAKFKKGDSVAVQFTRGTETLQRTVTFQ